MKDKRTLRIIFTILIYAGILVCVAPHLTGKTEAASVFLLTGVLIAVVSSILSCYCMEENAHGTDTPPQRSSQKGGTVVPGNRS